MQEYHIGVNKTARYFTLGELSKQTTSIWFICHGYGYSVPYFLEQFKILDDGTNIIIAPEGLSRFYMKGFTGEVGASWMTKEDRLHDIKDYINYLNKLYRQILSEAGNKNVKINVLGFSQGAATISRWVYNGKVKVDNFILWAGVFPADMHFKIDRQISRKMHIYLIYGNHDKIVDPIDIKQQEAILKKNKIIYQLIQFEGEHEIKSNILKRFNF